ncbi:MAG: hypothetical protein PHT12_00460 [Patescibacteria group bacterium]|nr:hypothetical protein [Patescibacteria group bacterium]
MFSNRQVLLVAVNGRWFPTAIRVLPEAGYTITLASLPPDKIDELMAANYGASVVSAMSYLRVCPQKDARPRAVHVAQAVPTPDYAAVITVWPRPLMPDRRTKEQGPKRTLNGVDLPTDWEEVAAMMAQVLNRVPVFCFAYGERDVEPWRRLLDERLAARAHAFRLNQFTDVADIVDGVLSPVLA